MWCYLDLSNFMLATCYKAGFTLLSGFFFTFYAQIVVLII